ncbi:MAG: tetratricopeptide repeat protein [Christensenella sp.]|nr:tetratricopeptide repeat protein [Christensenella sp.]
MKFLFRNGRKIKIILAAVITTCTLIGFIFTFREIDSFSTIRIVSIVFGVLALGLLIYSLPNEEADEKTANAKYNVGMRLLVCIFIGAIVLFCWNPEIKAIEDNTDSITASETPELGDINTPEDDSTSKESRALIAFSRGKPAYDKGDFTMAYPLLLEAAQLGLADAELYVGYCYYYGYGVQKDCAQAVFWFTNAADQGIAIAQYNAGYCYVNQIGTSKDVNRAFYYFKQAADQNDCNGLFWVGCCYEYGLGTDQDYQLALDYFTRARDLGSVDAQNRIDAIIQKM